MISASTCAMRLFPLGEIERIFDHLQRSRSPCRERWAINTGWDGSRLSAAYFFQAWANHDRALAAGQRALAIATDLGDVGPPGHRPELSGRRSTAAWETFGRRWSASRRTWRSHVANCSMSALACLVWPLCSPVAIVARSLAELGAFAEGRAMAEEAIRHCRGRRSPLQPCLVYVGRWLSVPAPRRPPPGHPRARTGPGPCAGAAHPARCPLDCLRPWERPMPSPDGLPRPCHCWSRRWSRASPWDLMLDHALVSPG